MIDIAELAVFFPRLNTPVEYNPFTFIINLNQKGETFVVDLKIKQKDTKEGHLISFQLGLGKHKKTDSDTHETDKPHFQIDIYDRKDEAFSATVYFTIDEEDKQKIMGYAKGTLVIISKIIDSFCTSKGINPKFIEEIIYKKAVLNELSSFESPLLDTLYDCYANSQLVVKQAGETKVIKTPHNLEKFLNTQDLQPLYLPLMKRVQKAE